MRARQDRAECEQRQSTSHKFDVTSQANGTALGKMVIRLHAVGRMFSHPVVPNQSNIGV